MKTKLLLIIVALLTVGGICFYFGYHYYQMKQEEALFAPDNVLKHANEGDISAQYVYGCYLLSGRRGVKKNETKGFELIQKSAEKNFPYAIGAMAYCYFHGTGVTQDKEKALEWFHKAEEIDVLHKSTWERWEKESQ